MNKRTNLVITFFCFILVIMSSVVYADEASTIQNPPEKKKETIRDFALGVTALKEHGFGMLIRYRINHFAFDIAAGAALAIFENQFGGGVDIKFPYQVDGGCSFFINDEKEKFQYGFKLAGVFNQATGYGVVFGGVGEISSRRFALNFSLGLMYFPAFEEYLTDYLNAAFIESTTGLAEGLEIYFGASAILYVF